MPIDETILIRPDYVIVYPTHPAYPLLVMMRNQEAELAQARGARQAALDHIDWMQGEMNGRKKRTSKAPARKKTGIAD